MDGRIELVDAREESVERNAPAATVCIIPQLNNRTIRPEIYEVE